MFTDKDRPLKEIFLNLLTHQKDLERTLPNFHLKTFHRCLSLMQQEELAVDDVIITNANNHPMKRQCSFCDGMIWWLMMMT